MRNKLKKFGRHIVLVFLMLLLGINVYTLIARGMGGNQMPMPLGIGAAVVQSGSMEPTYYKGDLLLIKEDTDYQAGDIVVYQSDSILVVHRIIEIIGDTVITQGDANNTSDEPFNASLINGRVVGRIPRVGYAIDFLKTPPGILLLAGCAVLLSEISFLRVSKSTEKSETAPREEPEHLRREPDEKNNVTENSIH